MCQGIFALVSVFALFVFEFAQDGQTAKQNYIFHS